MTDPRRGLPSVSALLESTALRPLLDRAPRALVVDAVRATVDAVRRAGVPAPATPDEWAREVERAVADAERPSLRPVVNATGVVLHTNLGRAPLAEAAIEAVARVARGYSNLEYDVGRGGRGSRYDHCAALLRELTGAEDALVVNNGAAALVLALGALARGREALVSRGELVEIGGSFRIPDIMARSGAVLREIGSTNRTHAADYRTAAGPRTGAIVKVHRSNFVQHGFVSEVGAQELAMIARELGVPLVHDLGSGLLLPLDDLGLSGEPTARDAVGAGATLVLMSGDKLLGGPQAGIVVGAADAVGAMRRDPLARSYRVDKMTLAALEATLALYREPARARREIPVLALLSTPMDALRSRADLLTRDLRDALDVQVVESQAEVGGGAYPGARIPSIALSVGGDAVAIERGLRSHEPPVVARLAEGRVLLDLRTVRPEEDAVVARALLACTARRDG